MSQKKGGIPQVSEETKGFLLSTLNFENGNVPIYWGPNSETSESYIAPTKFKRRSLVSVHEIVRLIYQGIQFTPSEECFDCINIGTSVIPDLHGSGDESEWFGWYVEYTENTCIDGVLTPGTTHVIGHILVFEQNPSFDCSYFFANVKGDDKDVNDIMCEVVDINDYLPDNFAAATIEFTDEMNAAIEELGAGETPLC